VTARVVQVSVSNGGVPKTAVDGAAVGRLGLAGDTQAHPEFHGGPDRAVCLWAQEVIDTLRAEGHPIAPGCAGENLTVRGLDWPAIVPGVQLRLGDALILEVTGYATPCAANARWFLGGDFSRISQKAHPGSARVYARVLTEGQINPGDAVVPING